MFNRRLTGVSDYEMLLTAQHSTAQHSTAQHSTAQHRLRQPFVLMSFYAQKHI